MTLEDINKISTIDEAKAVKYGGRDLKGDGNKNIFNDPLLNTNGSLDVTKLRSAAALLDKVKKAKFSSSKNSTLLTELKALDKSSVAYQVVNKNKKQIESVISKLETYEKSNDDDKNEKRDGKSKAEWVAEKEKQEASISGWQKQLKVKEKQLEKALEMAGKAAVELGEAEKFRDDIRSLNASIKSNVPLQNILNNVAAKNETYNLQYLAGNEFKIFESDVSNGEYKFFRADTIVNNISHRFVEIMREVDSDALFASIEDAANTYFASLRATPAKIATLKKIFKKWNESDDDKKLEWKWVENTMLNGRKKISAYNTEENRKKKVNGKVSANDFFFVLQNIFPNRGTSVLNDNPLLEESSAYALKDKNGNSILEASRQLKYSVSQRGDSIDNFNDYSDMVTVSRKLGKKTGTINNGLIAFIWEVFHVGTDPDFTLRNGSTDPDGVNRWKTELEHTGPFPTEKNQYFAEVKKTFDAALKNLVTTANVEWSKEWDKIAMRIFSKATKATTTNGTADRMKAHKNVKKLLKDHSAKMDINTDPLVSDSSLVRKVASDNWVVQHNFLNLVDEFLYQAVNKHSQKKAAYDSIIKGNSGKLSDEIANLKTLISDAEVLIESADENIALFGGSSLGQLKDKFKQVYDGGTNGGANNPKYSSNNLSYLRTLLTLIKTKEPNGLLDSEFAGYEKDLEDNIWVHLNPELAIIQQLTESTELTFEGRVKSLGFYEDKSVTINELTKIRDSLKRIEGLRTLTEKENKELEELEYYISNGKFKVSSPDSPKGDLDIPKLKDALGLTSDPSQTLVDNWTNLDGNTKLKTQAALKQFIDKYVRVDNRVGFLAHLGKLTGTDAVTAATDDEKLEIFLKRDPKKVIETIVDHILEIPDEKERIKTAFIAAKDHVTGKGLDMSKYDAGSTQANPSEKAIKAFAYEEMIGKSYSYQPKQNGVPGNDTEKGWFDKYVADYWYAPIWAPMLLVGLAIFYFWDNIANWWNGPVEEAADVDKESE